MRTVQGLYSAGTGSPSEDLGGLALPLQKHKFSVSLWCSCCGAIYTHSTTIIAKIYIHPRLSNSRLEYIVRLVYEIYCFIIAKILI